MSYSVPRRSIFITLSSVALILLATLFPFNFTAQGVTFGSAIRSFFSHSSGFSDLIGNVFLFLPFGVDLAYEFRQRRMNQRSTLILIGGLSALLSLTVETLQVFLPWRASSWIDICTNLAGGTLGAIVYLLWCQFLPDAAPVIAVWIRRLSPRMLAILSISWLISAVSACLILQRTLNIGTWHFPVALMFLFYGVFFVPLGILLTLATIALKRGLKFHLILGGVGIVLPALILEILLRGADLRKANVIVSMTIALFTLLVVKSRLSHLLRYW